MNRGDVIKVKLMDSRFNVYYKAEAHLDDNKQLKKLFSALRAKGVMLPDDWFL
jgi:hypothetical protein